MDKNALVKNLPEEPKKKKQGLSLFSGVSTLDVVLSVKYLAIMLRSSLAIEDALQVLSEQSNSPKLKKVFKDIKEQVHTGKSLSESMANYSNIFPDIVIKMVEAGEQGAQLEKNLLYLAEYLKNEYVLKKKIRGALFYPLMVLGLTFVESIGVIFFIMPKLQGLFSSFKNLPPLTAFLMDMTTFIRENVLQIVAGLFVLLILLVIFLKSKVSRPLKDRAALGFPIIKKLNKSMILANFARTLSILLESGIPIAKSLKITSETLGNSIYTKAVLKIEKSVSEGNTLAVSLNEYSTLFPSTFVKMIEVGESTGTLGGNLMYLHEFYAEEVDDMSKNLTTLLEPLLLIFMGLMIGGLAIAIVGPIYQLTSAVGNQ